MHKYLVIFEKADDNYSAYSPDIPGCSLLQYLDDSIAKRGLWMMGHIVDPVRLMNDMERMGIRIQTQVTNRNG
jgi:hypothetical protein